MAFGLPDQRAWAAGQGSRTAPRKGRGDAVLPTPFADEREQIVYEMAIYLGNSRWVSKGLYDRAVKVLGRVGIPDVITLMGYYTSVSVTLAFYDVPAGAPGIAR